jgi:hypothetical protein
MHVLKGSVSLDKQQLAKKVIANVMDFDMHNLFYPRPLLEEMADAATGAHEILPQKTLRDRQHGNSPLIVRPEYQGDFLDKLRQPLQGKPIEVEAGDEENLWDFSMPGDWLKHQESPHPRVMLDDFYEVGRPDKDNGGKDLKEYWDRSWDQTDAPEISEDKWLRSWSQNAPVEGPYKTGMVDPGVVIASYLQERLPLEGAINYGWLQSRTAAKLMADLVSAQITTQKGGERAVNSEGVIIKPYSQKPYMAQWVYKASGGKGGPYTVVLQFIPNGIIRDVTRLHVRVSCTCPSFLFWGAQYHAVMMDYLFGGIRPKFSPPRVRDPNGGFLICKHIKKVIEEIYEGKFGKMLLPKIMKQDVRRRIMRKPKFEVQKDAPTEKLKIPHDLIIVGKRPHIQDLVQKWPDTTQSARKKMIDSLKSPEEVMYLVHRFPHDASAFAADRFKKMIVDPKTTSHIEELAKGYYKELEGIKADLHIIKLPDNLRRDFGEDQTVQEVLEGWDKMGPKAKREYIMEQTNPDLLAYLGYLKHEDTRNTLSVVLERLHEIHTDKSFNPSEQLKADTWKRTII